MAMAEVMGKQRLEEENRAYRSTGGVSENNRCLGFRPAFKDAETGTVYPSLNASGAPCPFHCLDGLPPEVVTERSESGHVTCVKTSLEAGFERQGEFFTRAQAADLVARGE
ncbi:hypothetical protein [Aquisalimonas asiatica]|uniref:Uncharacterized protein n=1 Tax=Aquisalimonas asiatica TaxID=406100 RepID=A0A1H8TSY0_9GAMM|nr:hypothetical protein [Aquisalimonas asiatica]SEO93643.1 hypothetical protein SAMN04488052_104419 [Aquisalimonas asiatica]